MRRSRIFLKIYVVFSLLLGMLGGAATVYMALGHNPQGAYCEYVPEGERGDIILQHGYCNIVFGNLVPLVAVNAVFVSGIFLLPVALYLSIAALLRWLRHRTRAQG